MSVASNHWHVGLVGYGEVGRILAEDLRKEASGSAPTTQARRRQAGEPLRDHAASIGVALASSHADLAAQADLIVSAVTASQAVPVAEACAPARAAGRLVPRFQFGLARREAAAPRLSIDAAGGRYVEGAVMTSVPPTASRCRCCSAAPDARELEPLLAELGFDAKVASEQLGVASATKMCRS